MKHNSTFSYNCKVSIWSLSTQRKIIYLKPSKPVLLLLLGHLGPNKAFYLTTSMLSILCQARDFIVYPNSEANVGHLVKASLVNVCPCTLLEQFFIHSLLALKTKVGLTKKKSVAFSSARQGDFVVDHPDLTPSLLSLWLPSLWCDYNNLSALSEINRRRDLCGEFYNIVYSWPTAADCWVM